MPIEEVLDTEEGPGEEDRVQALLEKWAAKVREVKCVRSGRRGALIQHWRVKIQDGDDVPKLMHELAGMIVAAAEADAGGTRRTYNVALMGEPAPGRATPNLDNILIRAGDTEKPPRVNDVASTFARDMSERQVKLVDMTLGQLEKIMPLQAAAEERDRVHSAADAQVKIHIANLEFEERRDAREKKADEQLQVWLFEMAKMNKGILLAVEGLLLAKAATMRADLADRGTKKKATKKKAAKKKAAKKKGAARA